MQPQMSVMTMPYELLNRAGRRERAARERKMPFTRIKEKMESIRFEQSRARAYGLETRLEAVRARTLLRKGKINNPRFR